MTQPAMSANQYHVGSDKASVTITVPVNSQIDGEHLIQWLTIHRELAACNLILAHVAVPPWQSEDPSSILRGQAMLAAHEEHVLQAARLLDNIKAVIQENFPHISVHWQIETGEHTMAISAIARASRADRIVMFVDNGRQRKKDAQQARSLIETGICRIEVVPVTSRR